MRNQSMLFTTCGLLAGLVVGYGLGVSRRPAHSDGAIPANGVRHPPVHSRELEQTGRIGDRIPVRRSGRETGVGSSQTIELEPAILVDLTRSTQPSLDQRTLLFSDGDLVARALAIDGKEKAVLEHEWAKVKDRILQMQRETLRYEQGDDYLWIGADSFDGEGMRATFRESVITTLGEERGEAFLAMTRAEEAFGGWGRHPSAAYSIRCEYQSDGAPVYRITEQSSPEGVPGKSWISRQIPPHIREITDWLGINPEAPQP